LNRQPAADRGGQHRAGDPVRQNGRHDEPQGQPGGSVAHQRAERFQRRDAGRLMCRDVRSDQGHHGPQAGRHREGAEIELHVGQGRHVHSRHRLRQLRRPQVACQAAEDRAHQTQHQSLAEQHPQDLVPRRADGSQDRQLAATLFDVHQERVQNHEHRQGQRRGVRELETLLQAGRRFRRQFRAGDGAADDDAGRQQILRQQGDLFGLDVFLQHQIDRIDIAGFQKPPLRVRDGDHQDAGLLEPRHAPQFEQSGNPCLPQPPAGQYLDLVLQVDPERVGKARFQDRAPAVREQAAGADLIVANRRFLARVDAHDQHPHAPPLVVRRGGLLHHRHGGHNARKPFQGPHDAVRVHPRTVGDHFQPRASRQAFVHLAVGPTSRLAAEGHRHHGGDPDDDAQQRQRGPAGTMPHFASRELPENHGAGAS